MFLDSACACSLMFRLLTGALHSVLPPRVSSCGRVLVASFRSGALGMGRLLPENSPTRPPREPPPLDSRGGAREARGSGCERRAVAAAARCASRERRGRAAPASGVQGGRVDRAGPRSTGRRPPRPPAVRWSRTRPLRRTRWQDGASRRYFISPPTHPFLPYVAPHFSHISPFILVFLELMGDSGTLISVDVHESKLRQVSASLC